MIGRATLFCRWTLDDIDRRLIDLLAELVAPSHEHVAELPDDRAACAGAPALGA